MVTIPKKTEAQIRAQKKYIEKVARVEIIMEPEKKRRLQDHAESKGESVNGFVNRAISETIDREQTDE